MLAAQIIAAHEASMYLRQLAWHPEQSFEVVTKFLELAEKAARTMAMLTERLDQHRGRGQQQITVTHVTTNNVRAEQAIIAESVTASGGAVASPALLAATTDAPIPILHQKRCRISKGWEGAKQK